MGIADFFKKKAKQAKGHEKGTQPHGSKIDDREYHANYDYFNNKECPNCQIQLKQVDKKSNCPSCKEPMINEKHFDSKKKMLLTKEQAEKFAIEKQHYHDLKWAVQVAEKLELSQREINSMVKSTQVNTKFSVLWSKANDISMRHASQAKWLSYRNTRLLMGDIVYRDGHLQKALEFYLAVCFLDLNGPDDDGNFDVQGAALKASLLNTIREISKDLGINQQGLNEIYISTSTPEKNRFMPLTPEETLETFSKAYMKK